MHTTHLPSLATLACLLLSPLSQAQAPKSPPTGGFAVQEDFEFIDIHKYKRRYPDGNRGWMPHHLREAVLAKQWYDHLGPLGVRFISHCPEVVKNRPAFAAIVPHCIRTADGKLGLPAAEVVYIAPGSPADGHLRVGDLIIAIDNEPLKSGNDYRPGWDFVHKHRRGIKLMLGEKIDQAQARGEVHLSVLRYPVPQKSMFSRMLTLKDGRVSSGKIPVQAGDSIHLLVKPNKTQHYDQFAWLSPRLTGAKNSLDLADEKKIRAIKEKTGWGRVKYGQTVEGKKLDEPSIAVHASSELIFTVPDGDFSSFETSMQATHRVADLEAEIRISKKQAHLPASGMHKDKLLQIRFPIGKTNSFSKNYPKDCAKSEQMARRHIAWLAAQQRPDGSWPRLASFTFDRWDTSWCGLALLSSGDPRYDTQIKKAAYLVAYQYAPSDWTAASSMALLFLSEYYLRTQDSHILAGVQAAYERVLGCCKTDYIAGHKLSGIGYGIAGQNHGTGHMVLAMAVAQKTPIRTHPEILSSIFRHAGEMCVKGSYAYGRGRRLSHDAPRSPQGGNTMVSPALLGLQIAGGHSSAIEEYHSRMANSIGDADNSHATSTLAFVFSSLALAGLDEPLFLKHMDAFKYKMTIDDNWEGGFLKSSFPMDYQSGENVTATWIRTAASILVLNALKKNLVITGNKKYWSSKRITTPAVSEWGGQVHSYYLRNWCLSQELLGQHAPSGIRKGIDALASLARDRELVPNTRKTILAHAPGAIKAIANNKHLSPTQRGHAIELLTGIDFQFSTEFKNGRQQLKLTVKHPLHQLNWRDADKAAMFASMPWKFSSIVNVQADNFAKVLKFETRGTQRFDLDQGSRVIQKAEPLKDKAVGEFNGMADITFSLGDLKLQYQRPLKFAAKTLNYDNPNLRRLKLRLRLAPRAYHHSKPLIIAGHPFDCMYLKRDHEVLLSPQPGQKVYVHQNDEALVELASENFTCPWIYQMQFVSSSQVTPRPAAHKTIISGSVKGDLNHLDDNDDTTSCTAQCTRQGVVLEYDFGKATLINGLDLHYAGRCFIRVWYLHGNTWVPLAWDNYVANIQHYPRFPDTTARKWRIELAGGVMANRDIPIATLRFFHNPRRMEHALGLPQAHHSKCLPPIQPE